MKAIVIPQYGPAYAVTIPQNVPCPPDDFFHAKQFEWLRRACNPNATKPAVEFLHNPSLKPIEAGDLVYAFDMWWIAGESTFVQLTASEANWVQCLDAHDRKRFVVEAGLAAA